MVLLQFFILMKEGKSGEFQNSLLCAQQKQYTPGGRKSSKFIELILI